MKSTLVFQFLSATNITLLSEAVKFSLHFIDNIFPLFSCTILTILFSNLNAEIAGISKKLGHECHKLAGGPSIIYLYSYIYIYHIQPWTVGECHKLARRTLWRPLWRPLCCCCIGKALNSQNRMPQGGLEVARKWKKSFQFQGRGVHLL